MEPAPPTPPDPNPKSPDPGSGTITIRTRIKRFLIGAPRDLEDRSVYHNLSLVAFLAWVGLGADGLSSSAYGPEEAYVHLGAHPYLALALAVVTAVTVLIISSAYSRIIERFPSGGGGYVVATKLLGKHAGLVSGSALIIDYVLTITVSIAAAGDALFSLLPIRFHEWKMSAEILFIAILIILNLRGVKESIVVLTPIFLLFILTHIVLIGGGIIAHLSDVPGTLAKARDGYQSGLVTLGAGGLALLFLHAYSLGGGTYTGIEAVSNSMSLMREPRVRTAKRTMVYVGLSLALTAGGLLVCYLLWNVQKEAGKTLNAVLAQNFVKVVPLGTTFVILTLISEGALLVVAAQSSFIAGPRVLANMAIDSWVPRRLSALSERLSSQNGTLLMGGAALAALLYTRGNVSQLVVMYSINVFLTFSLSMLAMVRDSVRARRTERPWKGGLTLFLVGLALCVTILVITVIEKFKVGGWITLSVTGSVIIACLLIRKHYETVNRKLSALYKRLLDVPRAQNPTDAEPDPTDRVAVVLVAGYGGLGLHTFLSIFRDFPGLYKGVVFVSVGVVDSREFKGEGTMEALRSSVEDILKKYVDFARGQGVPATGRYEIGTDAIAEAEKLCLEVSKEFSNVTVFAGRVLFQKETWYQQILHNETAFALQKRLQWKGLTVIVVPARVVEKEV